MDSTRKRTSSHRGVIELLERLEKLYPVVHCQLSHETPFQLAVAVILSAQCTDKRVNEVTPHLFARLKTIQDFVEVDRGELESLIYSCGYYRSKARYIQELAIAVQRTYGGALPHTVDELSKLPGIGRKTANVISQEAFSVIEGIVVDTHVLRNSYRLGLGKKTKNAVIQERQLTSVIPKEYWYAFSHYMILLGRSFCVAGKPKCFDCPLNDICPKKGVRQRELY